MVGGACSTPCIERYTYGRYAIMLFYASFLIHAHVLLRFRRFLHFDSHSGANNCHAECLAAKLCSLGDDDFNHHHLPIHWSSSNSVCHVLPCPQQSNAYDCGMYMVECTRWLLNHSTIGSGGLDLLEADPTEVGKKMLPTVSHKIQNQVVHVYINQILKCMPNVMFYGNIGNPRVGIICTL